MSRIVALAARISPPLYGIVAIFTYGHSAAHFAPSGCSQWATDAKGERYCAYQPPSFAPIGGLAAAIFWPLYWSWELQDSGK